MKFLVYSNSPTSLTGYGVQCAHLVSRLKRDGHDVAVACNYGQQTGIGRHDTPYGPVRLYPMSESMGNSVETIQPHALDFFGGDPQAGWIISLIDQWVLNPIADDLKAYNVLAWTPVDHWPTPPDVARFFAKSNAVPVAMSKYAKDELDAIGLDAEYVPLSVDTSEYKPTPMVDIADKPVSARELYDIPADSFVALMVAMNKDPGDRKGFNEAFRAFGLFRQSHPDAVLVVHSDRTGSMGSGINLETLARHAGIPPESLIFTNPYARLIGVPPRMMAALFTAADVLLCPSRGEGFGVPMIEAQACGTRVIASDFASQTELAGDGWKVGGQLVYDAPQEASYRIANIDDVVEALNDAYDERQSQSAEGARSFALGYDTDVVWRDYWQPLLASLEPPERDGLPRMKRVDVLVPFVRDANRERLETSFAATAPKGKARMLEGVKGRTYAENVNALLTESDADWVLVVGDDCEFAQGWFGAARDMSDRFDVIGTNDSERGRVRNKDVAAGKHADHFFVRRSYIDDEGACLDGPGVLAPECYRHWFTDKEIIGLAKARGVYGHAHDSRVIHHHPGYDGNEEARQSDLVYMMAVNNGERDAATFTERAPLIVEQMTWRGRL